MRYDSYAQEYEDVILYAILGDVHDGFYIDVGGYDPTDYSVTKFFYDKGWRGINIEPVPEQCLAFEEERSRDINLCVGLSNLEESQKFIPIYSQGGCSTFDGAIASKENFNMPEHASLKFVTTLGDIYQRYCSTIQQIHFCKIDVEGYEKKVLEGIGDWNAFRPWVFVMESTIPQTLVPSYQEWEQILLDHGYIFSYQFCVNRYYIDCQKEHLIQRALKIDDFFLHNEITRMRMYRRPRKKLKERVAVLGLGEDFAKNKDRIAERSYVIVCADDCYTPDDIFWRNLYCSLDDIGTHDSVIDKYLICDTRRYDEFKKQLVGQGISGDKIVDIEYLRFDKL